MDSELEYWENGEIDEQNIKALLKVQAQYMELKSQLYSVAKKAFVDFQYDLWKREQASS